MGVCPTWRAFRVALLLLAAGCHLPKPERPATGSAAVPLTPPGEPIVARAAAPTSPPTVPVPFPASKSASLVLPDVLTADLPPLTEPPGALPVRAASAPPVAEPPKSVSPGEFLPPIPKLPDAPAPAPAPAKPQPAPPVALPAPSELPRTVIALPAGSDAVGPIELNGTPVTFDELSKLVDGNICSGCGRGVGPSGCSTCGDAPCRAGGGRCEPFPAHTAAGRVIGLIYTSVCCPDPCYQPKWEPLADAAFFTDAVRPKSSTRFRWDYADHYIYPDRGEFLFARADGNGKGPKPNSLVRAIPYVDFHELNLVTEIGMGAAGVQISMPYRSVNSTPFGPDGAGFADMTITAKTMLLDTELALFGFQMRTYIPIGSTGKGLGVGHVSLEPGLNFGLRAASRTYLQAQVVEWIPLGGDKDYQGPHLRWGTSINHILWRPVKDVQLVGTFETTGISFQDGLFTDPVLGAQRLAKRTSAHVGGGLRLFFCDTFDMGFGWQHAITGKYLARDFGRFEVRYRY